MRKTTPPPLKVVLTALIVGCMLLVASSIQNALSGVYLPMLFAVTFWLPLAWGLWHLRPLARKTAQALLWLLIVILPIGVINPFAAIDGAFSPDTPLWQLALSVFGAVAMALFALHILGKYKLEFSQ